MRGVGGRPAAASPATGGQRLYILPTRQGMFFLLVLGGLLAGAVNYGSNLGFLLAFLLGAMTFVSLLHTHRNLFGLRVESVAARPVFAGENAVFRLRVQRRGRERWAVAFRFGDAPETRRNLKGGPSPAIEAVVETRRRGWLRPGPLTVSSVYPFGLFRGWSRLAVGARCLVYPRPLPGPPPSADGGGDRPGRSPSAVAGHDFLGLRPFQPGDSLRRVSWKAWSRGQGMLVKEFGGRESDALLLDWNTFEDADPEVRLQRLCHLVLQAHRDGRAYGMRLPGGEIAAGRGGGHRQACLRALALHGKGGGW